MRYAILSDIHGNLESLEAVLKRCEDEGVEQYLCLGDIVGYGADPKECLDIIRDLQAVIVAGNHDWAVSGKLNPIHFNSIANEAVLWTEGQLSLEDMDALNDLELIHKNEELILVHSMLSEPEYFHYLVYTSQAVETFNLMDRQACFIGHTHAPQIIEQYGEEARCLDVLATELNSAKKYIVNVGSVGQPRDGNPMAAYCIYDSDKKFVDVRRTPYDIETAQEKIIEAGLPVQLAERLAHGR